ncbi:MAG: hypothetical protein K1X79_14330, partial [Oligoflexia bacterium]|nr:hypothetical protein [Oligoflexia bacterium]
MASDSTDKSQRALINLIKPIARFALERGMKHQDLLVALKHALIESAREKLAADEQTTSRISVLTGLHRYDVKKIEDTPAQSGPSDARSLIARVLSHWSTQRAYCDARGKPRPLSCDGKESEFAHMVSEVSQAINPYTILFDLERLHLVERTERGLVLKSKLLVDREDVQGGLELLAADSADLHQAIYENLFQKAELPNLHIRTEFDNIPESALPKLRIWLLKVGTRFHERVQRYLSTLDRDSHKQSGQEAKHSQAARVSLSSFSLVQLPNPTQ